ncbi:hypothetical protein RCL1_005204 [Eukaryota sp. TZLM3-RCL]
MDFAQLKQAGNQFFKSGNFSEAINVFSQALTQNPPPEFHIVFLSNRAAALYNLKNYEAAIMDSVTVVQNFPSAEPAMLAKNFFRIIESNFHLCRTNDARVWLTHAQSVAHTYGDKISSLTTTLTKLEKALATCSEAVSTFNGKDLADAVSDLNLICPNSWECFYYGIHSKLLSKEIQPAVSEVNKFLSSSPNHSSALFLLAQCQWTLGNIDKTRETIRNILSIDPDHGESKNFLKAIKSLISIKDAAGAAYSANDHVQALTLYTEFLDKSKVFSPYSHLRSIVYCNRAAVYMKQERYEEALNDSSAALDINPDYTKALYRKAQCELQTGDYQSAVFTFERLVNIEPSNRSYQQELNTAKRMAMGKKKDYYKVLGVDKDASDAEIKKKFRKESLLVHPDRTSTLPEDERKNAEKRFQAISEAYSVLSDPEKRRSYDAGESDMPMGFGGNPFGGMGGMGGIDISDIFQMMMGGQGGGNPFGGFGGGSPFGPNVRVKFG